jgi:hypothetical protein
VLAPSIGPVADPPRAEPRASEARGEAARAEPGDTPEMPVSAD